MNSTAKQPLTNLPLRAGMWALTFVEFAVGITATLTPRAFDDHVPWVTSRRRTPNI
ncbi:hypothetical protein [uncultured Mycobacterium sp.]|uniref:hypothetical protein n=1 Tax=uncultured Mycobacterium sp. TaxID=171292 RepID=UPI0035C99957